MSAVPQEEVNKGGRPIGSSTKISKLQRISTKLEQLARNEAVPLLEKSLLGQNVDKERLASAKFVITTAKQYHQAILAEKENLKPKEDKEDVVAQEDEDNAPSTFSLKIVPKS